VAPTPTISIELVRANADDLCHPRQWLRLGIQESPRQEFPSALAEILVQVTKPARDERWGAFWMTQSIEGQVRAVGLCSFKAEPNSLGEVEIAYYTFPHREGRGIATAMVHELTKRALRRVPLVIAHTLPIGNTSCKILRRCGYQRAGEVIDPDHGLVWRWQYPTNVSSER
jgi:RimJ/RimL family protein N-acetyltransferase